MASLLGIGKCGTSTHLATGKPYCDPLKDKPFGACFADEGVEFSAAAMASPAAFLAEYIVKLTAPRGQRIYPIWNLNNFVDKTGEPGYGSVGNLTTKQVRTTDPVPAFDFAHSYGELFHKKLLELEGGVYDLFIIDASFVWYGMTSPSLGLKGYSCDKNYVNPSKFKGSDTVEQYKFSVQLDSFNEYRDQSNFFVGTSAVAALNGINNVVLSVVSQTANVLKVKAIADGGKNLYEIPVIKTALSAIGAWTSLNIQTNVAGTLTSVASTDGTNKAFDITTDSTEYAALTSTQKLNIDLAAASVLYGLGVLCFESTGPVQLVKP